MPSTSLSYFSATNVDDYKVRENLYRVQESFRSIMQKNILDGIVIQTALNTGSVLNKVPHGLGKAPQGYIVIQKDIPGDVFGYQFLDPVNRPDAAQFLYLYTNASLAPLQNVFLWIF